MTLVAWMIRRAFDGADITVGLYLRDIEVNAPGYKRIAPSWKLSDHSAATSITFGPYDEPVSYDRYVIFDGGTPVETIREESVAAFPRAFTWDWQPEIQLGDGT